MTDTSSLEELSVAITKVASAVTHEVLASLDWIQSLVQCGSITIDADRKKDYLHFSEEVNACFIHTTETLPLASPTAQRLGGHKKTRRGTRGGKRK